MPEQTTKSIIVGKSVPEVYRLWADFESFPRFMKNIKEVRRTGERTSHWVAEGPMGYKAEWDAETTRLEANKRIAWNSREGSPIKTSGQVTFNELSRDQTEITVTLQYVPPAGKAGEMAGELFGDLERRLAEDLRNFKAYAEAMYERIAR